jgi:Family of unknown function (DUF6580)
MRAGVELLRRVDRVSFGNRNIVTSEKDGSMRLRAAAITQADKSLVSVARYYSSARRIPAVFPQIQRDTSARLRLHIGSIRPTISAIGQGLSQIGVAMNTNGRITFVVLAMCAAAIELRLGRLLPNVTAVGALALYSGSRLKPWIAWLPPIAVMAVTDLFLNRAMGYEASYPTYACFVLDVLLGWWLIRKVTVLRVAGAALLSAVAFFLVTNFMVWMNPSEVTYPKTLAGLLECYTAAIPFFRYTLAGNLAFAGLAFGADALLARAGSSAIAEGEVR